MVNPILASILKKAIAGGLKTQTGGGDNNETRVITFLVTVLVVTIIEFVACDSIAKQKLDDIKENHPEPSTSSGAVTSTSNVTTESQGSTQGFSNVDDNQQLGPEQLKLFRKAVNEEIYLPLLFINIILMTMLYFFQKRRK